MATYKCIVSGKDIPAERVEALQMLGVPESNWTCVEHSFAKPRQGIYTGEVGTSQLLIVDKVYDDSVRSVFRGAKKEATHVDDLEEDEKETYSEKELSYYDTVENAEDPEEKVPIIKRHV